jgi:hypothetical protein
MSPVFIAICLTLAGCSGCRNSSELRVVSRGYQTDAVVLWVSNQSMHGEGKRPRIVNATVSFDGVESEAKPKIEVFNSKYGWTEHATFSAPETATTAQIVAIVESGGRAYTVTQDWSRTQQPTSTGRDWVPGPSSITEREQESKSR